MSLRLATAVAAGALSIALTSTLARAEWVPLSVPLREAGYRLQSRRDGVKVYSWPNSSLVRIAAEGRIDAPPPLVHAALLAYERHVGAIEHVAVSRVVARAKRSLLVYQRLSLPIISDRDFALHVWWGRTARARWVRWKVSRRAPPRRAGVVRVQVNEGSWQLRPIEGGKATFARYMLRMDLGGSVPRWLARRGAGKDIGKLYASICALSRGHPCQR